VRDVEEQLERKTAEVATAQSSSREVVAAERQEWKRKVELLELRHVQVGGGGGMSRYSIHTFMQSAFKRKIAGSGARSRRRNSCFPCKS